MPRRGPYPVGDPYSVRVMTLPRSEWEQWETTLAAVERVAPPWRAQVLRQMRDAARANPFADDQPGDVTDDDLMEYQRCASDWSEPE